MSGAGSMLIAAGFLGALGGWMLWVLRPRKYPQHARRYRPDPVEVAALTETVPYADDPYFWVDRTVPFAQVAGRPPWDLEEEATARAEHGELVFGDSRGWQSGPGLDEATLRRELRLVDELDLPGEDGPVVPPSGPAGAGAGSEPSGVTARPAPGSWLDAELEKTFAMVYRYWEGRLQ